MFVTGIPFPDPTDYSLHRGIQHFRRYTSVSGAEKFIRAVPCSSAEARRGLRAYDLEQLYGANGDSIYGAVTDRKLNGGFKIPSKSELLDNLYFVGGSTHPRGGVPMLTLPGQLTADLIKERSSSRSGGRTTVG
ncbi:hypothetical protein SAMN04487969_1013 [Paenibacillus algorifonticola]|uniref:Phytoene desaturase n=1 Tax=Paenibacillus algorifonticola TaxID=684063 RepID=A0A1I1XPH3_9BACL|nr:hypothetical protein SAMN04487969_1013 [Paenibacillus algorifonticola]